MSIRSTSLKAFLIRFLQEKGQPCYLSDIYKEISNKLGKKDCNSFRAQIRGIFNASIKSEEGFFKRVPNVKGLYTICDIETDIEKYIEKINESEEEVLDTVTREEAEEIYKKHIKLAYLEANKLHGTSCIVPLDELHSACRIGLYKGACTFKPSKAKSDGNSPIPYLKRYIYGSLLNTIREQKKWNNRNVSINNEAATDSLKVEDFNEILDNSDDFLENIELKELKKILITEMKKHLNDDEFYVISKRYGLDNMGGSTFKDIGKEICSQKDRPYTDESAKSWSWQTEYNARKKLKKNSPLLRKLFQSYCD